MTKYYVIVFYYTKISRSPKTHQKIVGRIINYICKDRELGYRIKQSQSPEQLFSDKSDKVTFTSSDLGNLMIWLHQHPRVMLMESALASVGKLANSKHVKATDGHIMNKYERANQVMHCQTFVFSHAWHHIIKNVPKGCRVNVLSAIKNNLKIVK